MLVRRLRVSPYAWSSVRKGSKQPWRVRSRFASTAGSTTPSVSHSSPLAALTAELDHIAPRIDIEADQIEVIHGPADFYSTLKKKIREAKKRIYLSTLYIGKSEHELVDAIRHALQHNGPDLHVSILTDALRGTREDPEPSCASLIFPLNKEFPDRVEIRMYHTPNLTGIRKSVIPRRINEGWGLQHMKLYGVDDEVILSGANLSNDYFTNRQDRYHVFRSKRVSDFFADIHEAVCKISCSLHASKKTGDYVLVWPADNLAPNPLEEPKKYIAAATELLKPLIAPHPAPKDRTTTTSLYPLLVHPPTLNNELPAFKALFARDDIGRYTFTAGYFNPHPAITAGLLAASSSPSAVPGTILTASPWANGFYGSNGISGMLPAAYTHLSTKFLHAARGKSIQLKEWQRGVVGEQNGWTYHAKGLWATLPSRTSEAPSAVNQATRPNVTLIGSSNYTTRSYSLDLEVGAMVVTSDEGLKEKWRMEEKHLEEYTTRVTEEQLEAGDRKASWKVKMAMWIVKMVGGAL